MAQRTRALLPGELGSFCGQVALMLSAGIPLEEGLAAYSADDGLMKSVAQQMAAEGSLSGALRKDPRWPAYLVEMAAAGEQTGRLEDAMRGLSAYYSREERFRRAIAGAVTYPMVLGGMLVLIVLVMLWKVFPVFRRVLAGIGVGMTGSAGRMMSAGAAVGWLVLALVVAAMAAAGACVLLMRTGVKDKLGRVLSGLIPPLKRLKERMLAARLAEVLSMMLGGGFPMDAALEQTRAVVGDDDAARRVGRMREALAGGVSFTEALDESGLFDDMQRRRIRLGVAAGKGEEVMGEIAADCEERVEDAVTGLIAVIEPTLVALLAVVIGAVLLSVMLPMAGILTSML